MTNMRISGKLLIRDATLVKTRTTTADSGYATAKIRGSAVSAPRLSVGAEMTLEGECSLIGGLDLAMSDIGSLSISEGSSVPNLGKELADVPVGPVRSGRGTMADGSEARGS
jgi:hypothetical protein